MADSRDRVGVDVVHVPLGIVNRQSAPRRREHGEIGMKNLQLRALFQMKGERPGSHFTQGFLYFVSTHVPMLLSSPTLNNAVLAIVLQNSVGEMADGERGKANG